MSRKPKLPRITVREISEERVSSVNLPLRCREDNNAESHQPPALAVHQEPVAVSVQELYALPEENTAGPSSKAPSVNWVAIRNELISVYFEKERDVCASCSGEIGVFHIKCQDCGHQTVYCSRTCCLVHHRWDLNPFHKPQQWDVAKNNYSDVYIEREFIRPNHRCSSKKDRHGIQVFDQLGRVHIISVVTCCCEKDCVTLFRHGLWASTIEQPRIAFHVELLNTLEFAMLEGKMSLHAFCQSMRWRNNLSVAQCETLYKRLRGDPIEQYRHLKYQTRGLRFLTRATVDGSTCLACPEDGDIFISLDANFGLVRKKSAGSDLALSNHKNKMFLQALQNMPLDNQTDKLAQCSNFQAGTILHSQSKLNKLAATGVFGSACRHGVPCAVMDMQQGEKLSLSIVMIDYLLSKVNSSGSEISMHILYDVACMLDAHIKTKKDAKYNKVSFAVPVFHAYGHKASCQVNYSARWKDGYGLTDGEVMERLWSFLRRFSFITKEMTAAHRVDLLTDALLHYGRKKNCEMDYSLSSNLEKAHIVASSTETELQMFMDTLSLSLSDVDKLVRIQKETMSSVSRSGTTLTDEENYVQLLTRQVDTEKLQATCTDPEIQELHQEQLTRIQEQLCNMEKKIGIQRQWSMESKKFKLHQSKLQLKKKKHMLQKMHENAVEYEFVCSLKGKYGERNQKIAQRLQKQVLRASKSVRRAVNVFNKAGFTNGLGGMPDDVEFKDAIRPNSGIYQQIYGTSRDTEISNRTVSSTTRQTIAELRIRQLRAAEECVLIRKEMTTMLEKLANYHAEVMTLLTGGNHPKGIQVALVNEAEERAIKYYRAREIFSKHFTDMPAIPTHLLEHNISSVIEDIVYDNMSYVPSSDSEMEDDDVDYFPVEGND